MVKEKQGIPVDCPPHGWQHAVFHVTAPSSAIPELGLPSVTARFIYANNQSIQSPLFVVESPTPISREQKAVLIDARTEIPKQKFREFIEKIATIWKKEL